MDIVLDVNTPLKAEVKTSRYQQIKRRVSQFVCDAHFLLPCICFSILFIFILALLIANEIEFSKKDN